MVGNISFLEKKYGDKAKGKGMELGFSVQFSTGFEMAIFLVFLII